MPRMSFRDWNSTLLDEGRRNVENEARELQNQHLSQGLKHLENQPSDKQISISKYPIQGPCIKCMEKLWNRACKNTTYRIRVQSVPHTGDLRMYERSYEPFLHLAQWDRTCKHIMESLSNMFGKMQNTELPRPGKLERESELKTWCRVNISKPWPWTNCQKHFQ